MTTMALALGVRRFPARVHKTAELAGWSGKKLAVIVGEKA
jgi:hypothetical protein